VLRRRLALLNIRSYRSRATGGKSVFFLIVILVGYVAGIANKLFYRFDNVVYLYVPNLAMVSVDNALWFRNRNSRKKPEPSRSGADREPLTVLLIMIINIIH
jgi:hypothetical protein